MVSYLNQINIAAIKGTFKAFQYLKIWLRLCFVYDKQENKRNSFENSVLFLFEVQGMYFFLKWHIFLYPINVVSLGLTETE